MVGRILTGDALTVLRTLPSDSAHCCVTSPPYFGLRDYGIDGQVGLEETPDQFVAALTEVFREVRRVLRPDGTCWLNLGDSYAGSWGARGRGSATNAPRPDLEIKHGVVAPARRGFSALGIKPKDLLMMPARVAIALQADGWWLRSDIVWAKGNPMPESTTDRPTSSHEHVFLLTKSEFYFYDGEAIREGAVGKNAHDLTGGRYAPAGQTKHTGSRESVPAAGTRNARNVWQINSAPFRGAHFAVFPPELPRRCIAAGTSECGVCAACGAPFGRVVERGEPDIELQRRSGGDADGQYVGQSTKDHDAAGVQNASDVKRRILAGMTERRTTGWRPTCRCPGAYPVPATVMDPFCGAGTTLLVAEQMGRDAVGIELNPAYVKIATNRIRAAGGTVT